MKRPTLPSLIAAKEAEYAAVYEIDNISTLSVESVLARVQAAGEHALYAYIGHHAKQIHPLTCDEQHLQLWAESYNTERLLPVAALGEVTVTGADGVQIPTATLINIGERAYTTNQTATINQGQAVVAITATTGGASHNTKNTQATIATPIAGVDTQCTVTAADGVDLESIDAWRTRTNDAFNTRYQYDDTPYYTAVCKQADARVSHVWVYQRAYGVGSVGIRVVCDDLANRQPNESVLTNVRAAMASRHIAGSVVTVSAAIPTAIDMDIALTNDTATNRAAITDAFSQYVFSLVTKGATLSLAALNGALATVTSEYRLTLPATDKRLGDTQVAVVGEITWN